MHDLGSVSRLELQRGYGKEAGRTRQARTKSRTNECERGREGMPATEPSLVYLPDFRGFSYLPSCSVWPLSVRPLIFSRKTTRLAREKRLLLNICLRGGEKLPKNTHIPLLNHIFPNTTDRYFHPIVRAELSIGRCLDVVQQKHTYPLIRGEISICQGYTCRLGRQVLPVLPPAIQAGQSAPQTPIKHIAPSKWM